MKLGSIVLSSILLASVLVTGAQASSNAPQPKVAVMTAPGALSGVSTVTLTATVKKINKKTREVTLKKETGEEIKVIASEEVRNFNQIKVGDVVTSQYTTTLSIRVVKGASTEVGHATQESSSRAKLGEKPMGSATQAVAVRSKVTHVDPQTQTVTLEGNNGSSDVVVQDPEQFKNVQVGDIVDVVVSKTISISVTAAPKKK